jgi:PelA/Pel-15E family pectate lyase
MRWIAIFALGTAGLYGSVVGMSRPAASLTMARVEALPPGERDAWVAYVKHSQEQMAADKAVLAKEREGLTEFPGLPQQGFSARSIPLKRDPTFYRSDEARHVAEVVLSFQTPAGGWSKNLNMAGAVRARGQSYATANLAPVSSGPGDFDEAADENWHYVGTLDNDATNTELHFLAEMAAAWPGKQGDAYRSSFLRGVKYLLQAQYPNGGWPQVWPLEGGYHDAVTINDDALTESVEVLTRVGDGKSVAVEGGAEEAYAFVPLPLRAQARAAAAKGLACILRAQVKIDGELTVWAQQYDPLTMEPVAARNFEPAALSSGESASVMEYLMALKRPSVAVVRAVDAGAAWFESHQVMGYTWSGGRGTPGGRHLTAVAGAGPLWARYYSLGDPAKGGGKPIFGDRDKTIHNDVSEISLERRNGYAWYGDGPKRVLEEYAEWKKAR